MLVWQDAVSMFWEKPYWEGERYRTLLEKAQLEAELRRMVEVRGQSLLQARQNQSQMAMRHAQRVCTHTMGPLT